MMRIILFCLISSFAFADNLHKLNQSVESLAEPKKNLYKHLADELRCPTCTGLSVLQSDAPFSVEIKSALVEQVQLGKNEEDILKFFKERFGLWILRTPPREGFHWFAWYMPIALIVFGALAVWGLFWRRRKQVEYAGIRTRELILQEMDERLADMRKR